MLFSVVRELNIRNMPRSYTFHCSISVASMSTWRNAASSSSSSTVKTAPADDDDWETDADFVNDVTEAESRWGSKTVEGSGRGGVIDVKKLAEDVKRDDVKVKEQFQHSSQKDAAKGFGGWS